MAMTGTWTVPESFGQHVADWPDVEQWYPELSVTAARCAERWELLPDGEAMHGWTGVVWPVRRPDGSPAVLKVSPPVSWTAAEPIVLQAFAEAARPGLAEIPVRGEIPVRMVSALAMDVEARAMLLPRLDSARSLEQHPDIDGAVTVIAILLGGLAGIGPTAGLPDLADELNGLAEAVRDGPLDPRMVARARDGLAQLRELAGEPERIRTLHADCHFLNVLHTLSSDDMSADLPAWVGIDPGGLNGIIEWEIVPLLRNRWADAVTTGDPDRALRRRVDQVCEVTGADREVALVCAQVQAVVALSGWRMRSDHLHHDPYTVMAAW